MRSPARSLVSLALTGTLAVGLAACGGGADDSGGIAAVDDEVEADVEADVAVRGTDALKFEPSSVTAEAGEIAIELTAGPAVNHDVVIDGGDAVVAADKGETAVGTVELEAGEYTFYCSVPGHRTAGMEGTLTVE